MRVDLRVVKPPQLLVAEEVLLVDIVLASLQGPFENMLGVGGHELTPPNRGQEVFALGYPGPEDIILLSD